MIASSIRAGTRRAGTITITVTVGAEVYVYAYRRGTGAARHDLTVWPEGGLLAVGLFGEVISDIAVQAAESIDAGPTEWTISSEAGGYALAQRRAA